MNTSYFSQEMETPLCSDKDLRNLNYRVNIKIIYNAIEAANLIKSLLKNEEKFPDIIFVDTDMLQREGVDFLEQYKDLASKKPARTDIISLSRLTDPREIERLFQLGITKFINNPLTKEKLHNYLKIVD